MTTRRLGLLLLVTCVLGAACGRLNDGESGSSSGGDAITHPTGPDDLVLRWEYTGGFVSPETILGRIPAFSLYGDGRIITEGPQTEIYPGPALPNLLVQRIGEDGIQEILSAARTAGLTAGDATYPNPCVADVPETRFTVNADGRTSVVTAGALGAGAPGCQGSDPDAQQRLSDFLSTLGKLTSAVPAGSDGVEQPYTPSGLRIYVRAYPPDPELQQQPVRWPGGSLGTAGETVKMVPDLRCAVVADADVAEVLHAASSANQLTPWTSHGAEFSVVFRPLLPDETGC